MISHEPKQKLEGNLNFSGGSLGIFDRRGDIGKRYKNLTLFLDLEQHRQSAYSLLPNSQFTVGPDLRRNDLFFKTRYAFTPRFTLGFSANAYHNREEGRSAGETGPVSGLNNDSVQNYALVGDIIPTSRTTVQLRAYSARYDENSRLDSLAAPMPPAFANLNERYKRLDGTISQQLGSRNLLQGGYEWVQDNYKGANRLVGDNDGRQVTSNDVWLQDKIRLSSRATLDIGGRITSHSLLGTYAVPKIGLVVRLTDRWTARGSFGKGFRAPDLGQLYFRFANPASFYQVIGNPNLQAETSRSFSTGVDYRARRFRGGVSLFRNDVRNLIDTIVIGTPRTAAELTALLTQYGNQLIVVGGWALDGKNKSKWAETLAVMDISVTPLVWRSAKQAFQRRAFMAASHDGKMYVIGGINESEKIVRDVSIYNPRLDAWSDGPALPQGKGLAFAPAAGEDMGRLYVSVSDGTLLRLNEASQSWETAGSSTPRLAHRIVSNGSAVLVLGGAAGGKNFDLIEAVRPQ